MPHRSLRMTALAVLLLAGVALLPAACEKEPTPEPLVDLLQPVRVAPVVPSATPAPTTEAQATRDARATYAAVPEAGGTITPTGSVETMLPADPETVVVQLARIEPSPWEPEILAHMAPHFSLQASGFGVFRRVAGASESGWYQTVITPTDVLDFVTLLMDEIDVVDLATRHTAPRARFETARDGTPAGSGVIGVIYVRSASREGRLVIAENDMESPDPKDPDAARLRRLHEIVKWVEVWKDGVESDFSPAIYTPEIVAYGESVMKWWTTAYRPYSPESAVAFGTHARSRIAGDAPVAAWPLERPLSEVITADFGERPDEARLAGEDLAAALSADTARERSRLLAEFAGQRFWGPLWRDAGAPTRYLVGIRPAVPGSNHTTIEYDYVVPKRGVALSASGR